MEITHEIIEKAKNINTLNKFETFMKAEGFELTRQELKQLFGFIHEDQVRLSDEELEIVTGGKGKKKEPNPRYKDNQELWIGYPTTKNYLHIKVQQAEFYTKEQGWRYLVKGVDLPYDYLTNEYLETRKYVHTTNPGKGWHD